MGILSRQRIVDIAGRLAPARHTCKMLRRQTTTLGVIDSTHDCREVPMLSRPMSSQLVLVLLISGRHGSRISHVATSLVPLHFTTCLRGLFQISTDVHRGFKSTLPEEWHLQKCLGYSRFLLLVISVFPLRIRHLWILGEIKEHCQYLSLTNISSTRRLGAEIRSP